MSVRRSARVRAPEFPSGTWINAIGPLSLMELRGKVVLLDFCTVRHWKVGSHKRPGLAVDGDRLWFANSETSALRYLTADGELHTAIGEGLFDFGHVDGPASKARLQHPLGVAVLPDGAIGMADTYNGAIADTTRSPRRSARLQAISLSRPAGRPALRRRWRWHRLG